MTGGNLAEADRHHVAYVCYEPDEESLLARLLPLEASHLPGSPHGDTSYGLRRTVRSILDGHVAPADALDMNDELRAAHAQMSG